MADVKVYDLDGNERDWAYLNATYGRLEHLAGGGSERYRLAQVRETQGPALLKVRLIDADGRPMSGVLVILTFPSLTEPGGYLPDLTYGDPAVDMWSTRGVAQFTDGNGYTGFGLGSDSWIKDFAAGGPYHVWVYDCANGSDCMSWIGWLGGTDHRGPCSLTFQLSAGDEPDPDDGDDDPWPDITTPLTDAVLAVRDAVKELTATIREAFRL